MFPCFEISQKDDLFQVMVYLATENQLCPDPTPKSEEETIHQETDSLMGFGLIFCYKLQYCGLKRDKTLFSKKKLLGTNKGQMLRNFFQSN